MPQLASTKSTQPIDQHVGSRVRMRRLLIGMSQEKFAEALGITFQQVQKYEKGTNRISVGRLQHIATVLGVEVPYFLEGAPGGSGTPNPEMAFLHSQEGVRLSRALAQITDPALRTTAIVAAIGCVEAIAGTLQGSGGAQKQRRGRSSREPSEA